MFKKIFLLALLALVSFTQETISDNEEEEISHLIGGY